MSYASRTDRCHLAVCFPLKPSRAAYRCKPPDCQSAPNFDPVSASNFDPFERRDLAVALTPSELAGVAETA